MNLQRIKLTIIVILILLGIIGISYGVGYYKGSNKPAEVIVETKYIQSGVDYSGNIKLLEPVKFEPIKFNFPKYIFLRDTLIKDSIVYIDLPTDTLGILDDWYSKRTYNETLFNNDSLGNLKITADVQYNRLTDLGYTFTPIYKTVNTTITNKYKWDVFGGVGLSNTHDWNIQVGAYKNNFGIGYQFTKGYGIRDDSHTINILYKLQFK